MQYFQVTRIIRENTALAVLLVVPFPPAMSEIGKIIQFGDESEILGQANQLPVCSSVLVCFPESPYLEALLRVHEKVASQVVKHDCGFLVVFSV